MTPNNSDQAALHDDLRMKLSGALARAFNAGSFGAHYDSNSHADELIAALSMPASEAATRGEPTWAMVEKLQAALNFWLPCVSEVPDSFADRIMDDACLLMGFTGKGVDEPTFYDLANPQPSPAAHAGGEAWVPCSERMPESHSAYLVYGLGWDYPEADWYGPMTDEDDLPEFAVHGEQVTHWRTMPPLPTTNRADELTALLSGGTAREE